MTPRETFFRDLAALQQAKAHGVVAAEDIYRLLLRAADLLHEPPTIDMPPWLQKFTHAP